MAEPNRAEILFCDWLNREQRGEPADIESIAAANPDCAEELLQIHSEWVRMKRILKSHQATDNPASLADRLRERFGPNVDPEVRLDDDQTSKDAKTENLRPTPSDDSKLYEELRARAPSSGRYRLEGEIAQGGMGIVMRVFDKDLRRNLAMKVMLEEKEGRLSRFLEEAQVTGQLDHPGIVPVHELGIDQRGKVFFTMKLVKGKNLAEVFDLTRTGQEGWNVPRALDVLKRVCEAMAFAHEKRVIHRDLKPANVMVGRHGEVYVMDWGLARVLGRKDLKDVRVRPVSQSVVNTERRESAGGSPDSPLLTMDGDAVGTPSYMPLEQAEGDLDAIGPRSDVYAVGSMLYHLLSGHAPYVDPGTQPSARVVLNRVLAGPPEPVRSSAGALPPELVAICERAMGRLPAQRYVSMTDLADDLRAFLEHRVVMAHASGLWPELRSWVRRNRSLSVSVTVAILLITSGLAAFLVHARMTQQQAEELAAQARRQAYFANLALADSAYEQENTLAMSRALDDAPSEFRNWEWHFLHRARAASSVLEGAAQGGLAFDARFSTLPSTSGVLVLFGTSADYRDSTARQPSPRAIWEARVVPSATVSTDLSRIVSLTMMHTAIVWDGPALHPLREFAVGDHHGRPFMSPNGKYAVVSIRQREAAIYDTDTGKQIAVVSCAKDTLQNAVFTRDGSHVVIATTNSAIICSTADGQETSRVSFQERLGSSVALALSDSALVTSGADGMLRTWALPSGEPLHAYAVPGGGVLGNLCASSTGRYVAGIAGDELVIVWDMKNGAQHLQCRGRGRPTELALDPAEQRLAIGTRGGTIYLWDLPTSTRTAILRGHCGYIISMAFDETGSWLVSTAWDKTVRKWSVRESPFVFPTWEERRVLDVDAGGCLALPSPSGELIAHSLSPDNHQMAVRSAKSGTDVCIIGGGGGEIIDLVFDTTESVAATTDDRGRIALWDISSGALIRTLVAAGTTIGDISFDASGNRLASADVDGNICIWDLRQNQIVRKLGRLGTVVHCVRFSPDGLRILSTGGDWTSRVWNIDTGKEEVALVGHEDDDILCGEFSRDGATVATGAQDNTVRLWDRVSGVQVAVLHGHVGPVEDVCFSPDGSRIATAARDGTVRIWDATFGRQLLALPAGSDYLSPYSVGFSRDGATLWAASVDGVRSWPASGQVD